MIGEFKSFLTKSSALALAIGVIIGAATGKVVSAIVEDLLMPIIGLVMPGGDWRTASITLRAASPDSPGSVLAYGHFFGTVVDFIAIALVVFLIVKALVKEPPPAPTKACPECTEAVPIDAKKCKFCGSAV